MPGRLDSKVALISGGASGIGEATARRFAAEGAAVVVADIADDDGAALAKELGARGRYAHLDVRFPDDWDAAVEACETAFDGLDILVNNAGVGLPPRPIEEEPIEDHRLVIETNLEGVWLGTRAAVPALCRRGGGSVVNISSIDGLVGVAGMSSYAASKFAVTGITRSLALETGHRGIRVNSIHPGVIETPLIRSAPPDVYDRMQRLLERQAIPRMGQPVEIANVALFLASDESSYCTGASFVVDGGHIAGPYRDTLPG